MGKMYAGSSGLDAHTMKGWLEILKPSTNVQ